MNQNYEQDHTVLEHWPQDGIERLDKCPVCESSKRKEMYVNLIDKVFGCAPGKWKMFECGICESAYLDPRPTEESIGLAYAEYYTHEKDADEVIVVQPSFFKKTVRACMNGFRDRRYGCNIENASYFGGLLVEIIRPLAKLIDGYARNLRKPTKYANKLLDVGCGNGDFLDFANSCGWSVTGVDIDPKAVSISRAKGHCVLQGTLEKFANQEEEFDRVTASHVIEHVHHPKSMLTDCYRLLKQGGILWLETPNISSLGHLRFKSSWRGLETPRHLVLFNKSSLKRLLEESGFSDIKFHNRVSSAIYTYAESEQIAANIRISSKNQYPKASAKYMFDLIIQYISVQRREFHAVTAKRPLVQSQK